MPELKVRAFSEGANDYLIKWPHKLELVARIRHHSNAYIAYTQRDQAFLSLHQSQEALLRRTQELAESQAALHRSQKLEAIGKLTGGVAHDFNNVLQIISGNLQLLRMEADGHVNLQERIAAALQGVERGASLASQLLAFARRQPLQPAVTDIGSLLLNAEKLLQRAIDDMITLKMIVTPDLWNTMVDPNQLENVLFNVVLNARDAMDGKGELVIEARNVVLDGSEHRDDEKIISGDYVQISITDNGPGMPPEILERAFEPFFTTKSEGEGTGLGLSMAYGFIKQSDGHIQIESTIGLGTVVRILLPRSIEHADSRRNALPGKISAGSGTILVVEDEAEIRATTVEILSRLGYRTLQAEDALSGLKIMERGEPVDLLFTDVVMPGPMRSVEMVERAKKLCPNLQVLFASGYTKGSMLENGRLDPGVNLLSKPYSHDDLARKIKHMLRGDRPQESMGDQ
jgi:signal transduction histidine kinase